MVDKIFLPTQISGNLNYTFDYNADATSNPSTGWGEISKITLPSGAYSGYTYVDSSSNTSIRAAGVLQNRLTQKTLNYLKEYDGNSQWATDVWTYSFAPEPPQIVGAEKIATAAITAPDGSVTSEYFGGWNGNENPTNSMYNEGFIKPYKSVGADGTTVERVYADNIPAETSLIAAANQFVKYELTSITDNSGTLSKTTIKEYAQDKNGNTTQIKEYDFVPYLSVTRDSSGRITNLPSNLASYLKRVTTIEYYNDVPDSASTDYTDADSYHLSSTPRLLNLVKSTEVQNASGTPQSRSEMFYDYTSYATNTKGGNLTGTTAWDSIKGAYSNPLSSSNSISTSAQYNAYGMPTRITDAKNYQTQITYGMVGNYSGLYPTQTEAAYGTSVQRTSTAQYDFNTGLVTSTTDIDNNLTNATVYDAVGRPQIIKAAVGTAQEVWTQTTYDDVNRRVVSRSDLYVKSDGRKVATQFYDQLGRVRLTKTLEDVATQNATNETDGIKVQTRYQTGNPYSYQWTSNPYRAATSGAAMGEESMGWTRSKSVNTGRHSEVETFLGASFPDTISSSPNSTGIVSTDRDADRTLVTDQTGNQRISQSNALGQLMSVWEIKAQDPQNPDNQLVGVSFPNQSGITYGYLTSYGYDTLNNLTTVNQGAQARSFAYDSLSRLKSATNPESGLIQYAYDNNGNLTSKIDARSITTTYGYDALNRVIARSYNDNITPAVAYTYDNLPNAKGKLTSVTNGTLTNGVISNPLSVTQYQAFDTMGRVTQSQQWVDGTAYGSNPMTYIYNLSGALIEEKYPSGRTVKNVLDAGGDLAIVQSSKNVAAGYFNYAKNFTYTAAGAVSSMQLGNGKWESTIFNNRLQPTQIALGTTNGGTDQLKLNFDYGAAINNGNVLSQQITVPTTGGVAGFTATQTYSYDSLNRLKNATEMIGGAQSWKQTFNYDRYGNRNFEMASTTTPAPGCQQVVCNPTVDPNTNKLVGYTFDNAGNTTKDAQGKKFTYDGENKQTKVETVDGNGKVTGTVGEYVYDGDGKRVKKYLPSSGETTIFVYDASGKMVAEYSTTVEPSATARVSYLTTDQLGSPRMTTDRDGKVFSRRDFMPFGEEITQAITGQRNVNLHYGDDGLRQKFTSYERDTETEDDFAQARYYNSKLGRFTSVDPTMASADIINPQTFNRYVYVGNNPVNITDPTGEIWGINGNTIRWFADNDAMKAEGFVASSIFVGSIGNQLYALNPNYNIAVPVATGEAAITELIAWGAAADTIAASAATVGVPLVATAAGGWAIANHDKSPALCAYGDPSGMCLGNNLGNTLFGSQSPANQTMMNENTSEKDGSNSSEAAAEQSTNTENNKIDTSVNRGGGKDARKINQNRKSASEAREAGHRAKLKELESQPRTNESRARIIELKKLIKHEQTKQKKSESHGRTGKRN